MIMLAGTTYITISLKQKYRSTLLNILDQLPHKIFLKDKDGKMALVNTIVAKAHHMSIDGANWEK